MQVTTAKIQHAHPTSYIVYKLDRKHRGKAVVWLDGCWLFITYVGLDSLAAVAPASVGKKTTITIALLEVALFFRRVVDPYLELFNQVGSRIIVPDLDSTSFCQEYQYNILQICLQNGPNRP
jgi:hypothetical protein